ncbi:MAG: SprT-like domain-containing protein [Flavobacteriales bacterium]|nr:SprT-like domain-containing protein [Flavobacteriales bacterium]
MKNSTNLEAGLLPFIPEAALEMTCSLLRQYPHHLVITPPRSTVHGDFRPGRDRHTLTVNGDRNRYAFLITLLHEMAHLITFNTHASSVKPHGKEWKSDFVKLLRPYLESGIFPADITDALKRYMLNPAAATCSDINLSKVLSRYDKKEDGELLLDDLPVGALFMYRDKRKFVKETKRRTRWICKEVSTGQTYFFSPVTLVKMVS